MSPSSFCGFWLVFSSPVLINFPSIWIVLESSSSGITHVAGSLRENAWPAYQAPCLDEPPETYSSEGRLGKVNQRGTQDSQEPLAQCSAHSELVFQPHWRLRSKRILVMSLLVFYNLNFEPYFSCRMLYWIEN